MDKPLKIKRSRHASLDKRRARAGYFFVAPFVLGIILIYLPILPDAERRRAALELEALRELCLPLIGGLRGAISRASVGLLGIRRAASLLCLLHRVKNRGGLV